MIDEFDEGIDSLTRFTQIVNLSDEILEKHREIARATPAQPIDELQAKLAESHVEVFRPCVRAAAAKAVAEKRKHLDDAISQAVCLVNTLVRIDEELAKLEPANDEVTHDSQN